MGDRSKRTYQQQRDNSSRPHLCMFYLQCGKSHQCCKIQVAQTYGKKEHDANQSQPFASNLLGKKMQSVEIAYISLNQSLK